ncbi:MAG TPA: metallopeptidase family protein [Candidatus Aerophobetes bacterium]|uniref:Metallopeptidase family protein n=1 Tax=Aerophobetes bacterium TaxID=2030807 RepID=A0A662DGK9_UNCAE|nr:MAG: hypothetical protein DRI96_01175 [Candidatus Aerophobetes bacterium]HDN85391.1 metallopeptidase family protein [Candidatus Aerophobetes bacterium]
MEKDKFEKWVLEAIDSLPQLFKEKLNNIHITVEDWPPVEFNRRYRFYPPIIFLGLYQGVPLPKRGIYYSSVLPDKITIFRRPIEKLCPSEEKMREMVIKTVLHEIGHYFGLSEEELKEI